MCGVGGGGGSPISIMIIARLRCIDRSLPCRFTII